MPLSAIVALNAIVAPGADGGEAWRVAFGW